MRGCDPLGLWDVIWHICKAGPYCGYHDLDHITPVCCLDRKPEHCENDSGYYGHWIIRPSSWHQTGRPYRKNPRSPSLLVLGPGTEHGIVPRLHHSERWRCWRWRRPLRQWQWHLYSWARWQALRTQIPCVEGIAQPVSDKTEYCPFAVLPPYGVEIWVMGIIQRGFGIKIDQLEPLLLHRDVPVGPEKADSSCSTRRWGRFGRRTWNLLVMFVLTRDRKASTRCFTYFSRSNMRWRWSLIWALIARIPLVAWLILSRCRSSPKKWS